MWEKNRPEAAPRTKMTPAAAPEASAGPVAQTFRVPEKASRGTAIGETMSIIGDIYSEEDLVINGQVRGTLDARNSLLTVGPNGKAESNVKAREVVILGSVKGDVEASSKITIRKEGSLVGNIKTTGIVIDDDAYFKGSIDIVRKPAETAPV